MDQWRDWPAAAAVMSALSERALGRSDLGGDHVALNTGRGHRFDVVHGERLRSRLRLRWRRGRGMGLQGWLEWSDSAEPAVGLLLSAAAT